MRAVSRFIGVIMVIFSLPFAGGGCFILNIGYLAWRDAARARNWEAIPATLLEVRLQSHPGKKSSDRTYEAQARYSYVVDGRIYESERIGTHAGADNIGSWQRERHDELKRALDAGGAFTAYVNPADPSESVLFPEARASILLFHGVLGGIFALVGIGIFIGGLRVLFGGSLARKLERQFPAEPWKWRQDWSTGIIKSDNRKSAIGLLLFAVFWLGISSVVLISMVARGGSPPIAAVLVVVLFECIGIAFLVWAIRELRVATRYGAAELHLASVPGVIGGKLAGVVTLPDYAEPYEAYRIELTCERTVRRGKSSTRVKEWGAEVLLDPKKMPAKRDGVQLPVLFGIPYGLPPAEYPVSWTLRVRGKQPGIDVDVRFSVPVFVTAESRSDFRLDDAAIRPFLLDRAPA